MLITLLLLTLRSSAYGTPIVLWNNVWHKHITVLPGLHAGYLCGGGRDVIPYITVASRGSGCMLPQKKIFVFYYSTLHSEP